LLLLDYICNMVLCFMKNAGLWALHTVGSASGLCYYPVLDAAAIESAKKQNNQQQDDSDISLQVQKHNELNNSLWAWITGKEPINVKRAKKVQHQRKPAEHSTHMLLIGSLKRVHFAIRRNLAHIINCANRHRQDLHDSSDLQNYFADYCDTFFQLIVMHQTNLQEIIYPRVLKYYEQKQQIVGISDFVQRHILRSAEDYIKIFDLGHELVQCASRPRAVGAERDYDTVLKNANSLQSLMIPVLEEFEERFTVDQLNDLVEEEEEIADMVNELIHAGEDMPNIFMMVIHSLSSKEKSDMHDNLPWVIKQMYYHDWNESFTPLFSFMKEGYLSTN